MDTVKVLQELLAEAKRKLWLTKTSIHCTPKKLAKYQERVNVLKSLLGE